MERDSPAGWSIAYLYPWALKMTEDIRADWRGGGR
jgi:hypothetical protein